MRRSIPQSLSGVGERFGVHVFVENGQKDEVNLLRARLSFQSLQDPIPHCVQVTKSFFAVRQGQFPTDVMRDGGRIIKRIRLGSDRFRMAHAPQDPLFLEPSQMTDFPNERVDDCQPGTEQLIIRQVFHQLASPLPGILDPFDQF